MGAFPGEMDLEDLSNNEFPIRLIHEACPCQGNWLLRARSVTEGACSCAADFNGDCIVGLDDFHALVAAWGPCPEPPSPCPADLNKDGRVTVIDLLILLGSWG